MAVNLFPPEPSEIYSVPGVVLGVAAANIRKPNRNDVLVVELALGSRVAGVFTSNRFAAAPVQVCRAHLAETNNIRALVVNTGIANAGTANRVFKTLRKPAERSRIFLTALRCRFCRSQPVSSWNRSP